MDKRQLSTGEERWAINRPVQGSAANALKVLLARLEGLLPALDSHVVLAPYDAVLIEHPMDERRERAVSLTVKVMKDVMRELFPGCEPRVDVNGRDPSCWNKDGHGNSIENFLAEMERGQ